MQRPQVLEQWNGAPTKPVGPDKGISGAFSWELTYFVSAPSSHHRWGRQTCRWARQPWGPPGGALPGAVGHRLRWRLDPAEHPCDLPAAGIQVRSPGGVFSTVMHPPLPACLPACGRKPSAGTLTLATRFFPSFLFLGLAHAGELYAPLLENTGWSQGDPQVLLCL